MSVPFTFAAVPGGTTIPLSELDANFNYATTSPSFSGTPVFPNGFNIFSTPVTGVTGAGSLVLSNSPILVSPTIGSATINNPTINNPTITNATFTDGIPLSTITGLGSGWFIPLSSALGTGWAASFASPFDSVNGVTNVNVSGGSSGLVFSGGPVTSTGTITLSSGILGISYGGTGLSSLGTGVQAALSANVGSAGGIVVAGGTPINQYAVVVGGASNTVATIPTGSAGQVLRSAGSAANPAWSTAVYPATVVAGTVLAASAADVVSATSDLTLGVAGTTSGSLTLSSDGATSGEVIVEGLGAGAVTLNAPNIASNITVTLPSNAGSLLLTNVGLSTGSVLFVDSVGVVVQDNTNFFWDDTNNRLGLGTNTPATQLYVSTNAAAAVSALGNQAGPTVTLDMATANNFSMTLTGNCTLANPSNATVGQTGIIYIVQDAVGSQTLAYASNWDFPGATAPTLTTTANATDVLVYSVQSSTSIVAQLLNNVG